MADLMNGTLVLPGKTVKVWAKHNQINATNPCSEYAFLDDTACNLASINLYKFYQPETGEFLVEDFKHTVGFDPNGIGGLHTLGSIPNQSILPVAPICFVPPAWGRPT
jgi:ribonucleoside-diphosphate reductase alpha chain